MGRGLCAFTAALALAATTTAPAAAQGPVGGISSSNIEHVTLVPLDGRANGGKLLGKYLYVTTGKALEILDVSEPTSPTRVGKLDFELLDVMYIATGYQEDVDTDGRFLIRSDSGQMQVIDVRDPTKPAVMGVVDGVDNHTMSCVLSCTWAYGSEGKIVDMRDPANPKDAGVTWDENLELTSSHDVTEVSPGIVVTATEPMYVLDVRADPKKPRVLAKFTPPGFVHGTTWPHLGMDDIALGGGEAVGPSPACESDPSSTFYTMDTRNWRETKTFKLLDEYALKVGDEGATASVWCTHWFDHHPTFGTGGLVSIAWYEQGIRLLSVARDGQIAQTGYFIPHGGSIWDVRWITPDIMYTFDHHRGIDILRYTGEIPPSNYTPPQQPPSGGGSGGGAGAGGGSGSGSGPGQPGAPARKSVDDLVRWTSAKRCVTPRSLSVRARQGAGVTEIVLKIGKRTVKKATGKALGRALKLKTLPKKRFSLRVEAVSGGERAISVRAYRTCSRKRR